MPDYDESPLIKAMMGLDPQTPLRQVIPGLGGDQSMVHSAPADNPAQPYAQSALDFAQGGLQRAMGWPNNFVGEALQNPDNMLGIGMALPPGRLLQQRYIQGIQKLLDQGKSHREIGETLGIGKDAAHGIITRNRLQSARPPNKPSTGTSHVPLLDEDFDEPWGK